MELIGSVVQIIALIVIVVWSTFFSFIRGENIVMFSGYLVVSFLSLLSFGEATSMAVGSILLILFLVMLFIFKKYDKSRVEVETDKNLDEQNIGVLMDGLLQFKNRTYVVKNADKFDNLTNGIKVLVLKISGDIAVIKLV